MRGHSFHVQVVALLILCLLPFISFNHAQASPLEIFDINPNEGSCKKPPHIVITGEGFQPLSTVAIYGGGPYIISTCEVPDAAMGLFVAGSYAYVADGSGLQVVDISDSAHPVLTGTYETEGSAFGVFVAGLLISII